MFIRYNLFGLTWALLLLVMSLLPAADKAQVLFMGIIPMDLLVHFFVYVVLVLLLTNGFWKQYSIPLLNYRATFSAFVLAAFYGMILEVLQETLTPDRHFELVDIFANLIGCGTGSALYSLIYFKF